ncbi:MAG: hypothetical protein OXU62_06800 [Gammaproteobacteria bacterium]|nr:hypothetical protein [Gammaproteobacteria bacterium]
MNTEKQTTEKQTENRAAEKHVLTDAQLNTVDGAAANDVRQPNRVERPRRPRIFGIGLPPA